MNIILNSYNSITNPLKSTIIIRKWNKIINTIFLNWFFKFSSDHIKKNHLTFINQDDILKTLKGNALVFKRLGLV